MKKINNTEEFVGIIKNKLNLKWQRNNKSIFVLFAYNSTGKTMISSILSQTNALCYNSFFEDLFYWDEKNNLIVNFEKNIEIINFILDQGLDNQIRDVFHEFVNDDIEADINFQNGEIYFYKVDDIDLITGENYRNKIKISRAEETLFKFSVYYVLLDNALLDVNENYHESIFKNIEYIVIDDPTSNLDDSNIIRIANKIIDLYDNYKKKYKIKFLVETHNTLFLDIIRNRLMKNRGSKEKKNISLFKLSKDKSKYLYENISSNKYMAYHLDIKYSLDSLLKEQFVSKSAYNLLRILLEKQATYMGCSSFSKCLRLTNNNDKEDLIRCLNHYSHGNLSEIEMSYMDEKSANIIKEAYDNFLDDYGWRNINE